MKRIVLLAVILSVSGTTASQSINNHPIIIGIKHSSFDTSLTVPIIGNMLNTDTFKVNIHYNGKGSAVIGRDFNFTPQIIKSATQAFSFDITIMNSNIRRKTIILEIKANSKDTMISIKKEIVLTSNVTQEVSYPIDATNTPKFEFVNYTDFKGFDQNLPNGIAQSQFLFKIPINRRRHQTTIEKTYTQWFRSLVFPNFLFNRIDKTNKGVTTQLTEARYGDSTTYSKYISSFDFMTKSHFVLNGKLAVFTLMRPYSRLQLQLIGSIYKIKVDSMEITRSSPSIDSTSKVAIGFNPIYATGVGLELFYDTHYTEEEFPFNFRFIAEIQSITMRNSDYIQADIASTAPDNTRRSLKIRRNGSSPIITFSAMIKKDLGLKKLKNEDHYLFFRYNYSWQRFKASVPIINRPGQYEIKSLYNNFSQFQLGVDLNFDGFFK